MCRGFSTVEIIITTLIIFSLILISFYYYSHNIEYAKLVQFIQNVRFIKIASEKYYIDKNIYPQNITDLFIDPYKDYLPRQLASEFVYSSWGSEIKLYNFNSNNKSILFLYLEYRSYRRKYIPSNIIQKLKREIYFHNFYSTNTREYMVFVISFVQR